MAFAFSFIIQNDFLYTLKTNETIKSIWPIKLKNIEFEKICRIQSSIGQNTDLDFSRLYSMFYHHMYNQHVNRCSKYKLFHNTFKWLMINVRIIMNLLLNGFCNVYRK